MILIYVDERDFPIPKTLRIVSICMNSFHGLDKTKFKYYVIRMIYIDTIFENKWIHIVFSK